MGFCHKNGTFFQQDIYDYDFGISRTLSGEIGISEINLAAHFVRAGRIYIAHKNTPQTV